MLKLDTNVNENIYSNLISIFDDGKNPNKTQKIDKDTKLPTIKKFIPVTDKFIAHEFIKHILYKIPITLSQSESNTRKSQAMPGQLTNVERTKLFDRVQPVQPVIPGGNNKSSGKNVKKTRKQFEHKGEKYPVYEVVQGGGDKTLFIKVNNRRKYIK